MECPKCGHEFKSPVAVKGGMTKSKARQKASAQNGKLGGRPKKKKQDIPPEFFNGLAEAQAGIGVDMRKVFEKAHDMARKRDDVESYLESLSKLRKEQRDLKEQIAKDKAKLKKLKNEK